MCWLDQMEHVLIIIFSELSQTDTYASRFQQFDKLDRIDKDKISKWSKHTVKSALYALFELWFGGQTSIAMRYNIQ